MPKGVYDHYKIRGHKLPAETKIKISQSIKDKYANGYKNPMYGNKPSEELIQRRAEGIRLTRIANGNFSGTGHPNYKDGKAPLRKRMYNTRYYQDWRKSVYERDSYTCQFCGQVGGKLHADHIKRFAEYPELRFELSNGRTLCVDCHKKTDTYGYHSKKAVLV